MVPKTSAPVSRPATIPTQTSLSTHTPPLLPANELRKRETSTSSSQPPTVSPNVCGTDGAGVLRECPATLDCAATILQNGDAYAYCSTRGFVPGPGIYTTKALSSWFHTHCPEKVVCCPGAGSTTASEVETDYFIASGYTVTAFGCASIPLTVTWDPARGLLDPPKFSASLARLTSSSKSKSTTTKSSTPSTSPPTPHPNATSLSVGAEVGIGVGVGFGCLLLLLIGVLIYRGRKRKGHGAQQMYLASGSTGAASYEARSSPQGMEQEGGWYGTPSARSTPQELYSPRQTYEMPTP